MNNFGHSQRQAAYLQAMGIQTWVRKTVVHSEKSEAVLTETPTVEAPPMSVELPTSAPRETVMEAVPSSIAPVAHESHVGQAAPARDVSRLDWPQVRSAVSSCTACVLHESRTQTVFGVGDQQAQWLIVGEAPGVEEDSQGEPFVGHVGKLLNNMLQALGLKREQVYITNILKCRPPDNRDPRPAELAQCEGFLQRQVELIQPKVILAMGRIAAHKLLKSKEPLGRMRGSLYHYSHHNGETPVVVTYHPAYLLRTPRDKARAWEDLRFALKVVQGEVTP